MKLEIYEPNPSAGDAFSVSMGDGSYSDPYYMSQDYKPFSTCENNNMIGPNLSVTIAYDASAYNTGHSEPIQATAEISTMDLDFWDFGMGGTVQTSPPQSASPGVSHTGRRSSACSSSGREDLSPGSVNGYSTQLDNFDKKKKGPQARQQDELCLVCGDRASGYHYNALTCEGCKGFFRRSITKNAVYQCKYGASCEIDMYMRRKCQECRLKKCLSVGMRPECVVPEQQCAVKREAKKQLKEKDKPNSTTSAAIDIRDADSIKEEISYTLAALRKRLTAEQEELIHRLVFFQDEFENPSEEDVRRVTQLSLEADDSERGFRTITEMTILTVQLTVEFSKRLPGFDTLLREDQITLLKACSSEVMMLRGARKYDAETDSIVFANNLPYTKDRYAMTGVEYTADELYGFARKMYCLKTDNAEYALITAIVIFSERTGLLEPKKVEKIQEIYMDTLYAYVFTHRSNPTVDFAKLISIPTTLRTLGTMNADLCMALKLKNKRLPQFLREIWDI
ncbi:ecdysone receptor-like isoform X2 [Artemia franciscana]|uniref:ecdysone receptor-like isoform X2 n=1 Tax=Artemia franciscana TaxID=6661 RepID=UPI0032DA1EB0